MISPEADPLGIGVVEALTEMEYDYIELSLAAVAALPPAEFCDLARRLERSGLPCEACNNFFPARVRLTGPDAYLSAALQYATLAMDRARQLGVKVIVFGSSGAKNVPVGFDTNIAWAQLVALLRNLGPMAEKCGLTIAIEPLNRLESNIVTTTTDGLRLAGEVDHPHVGLLVDLYHLMMEHEDAGVLLRAGQSLSHLHVAQLTGRTFPRQADVSLSSFFTALRQVGYTGRCSVEAYTSDFTTDAVISLRLLRAITNSPDQPRLTKDITCPKTCEAENSASSMQP